MNGQALLDGLFEYEDTTEHFLGQSLLDDFSAMLVRSLKDAVDEYWGIDARVSLDLAKQITRIGEMRQDKSQIALGKMAQGDSRKYFGNLELAWQEISEAGDLFLEIGEEENWARTWIGRLLMSADLNRVNEALENADRAYDVLNKAGNIEKLVVLQINRAIVHDLLGQHETALEILKALLPMNDRLVENGMSDYRGMIYSGLATASGYLGIYNSAMRYHDLAHASFVEQGRSAHIIANLYNRAYTLQSMGHYYEALRAFRELEALTQDLDPVQTAFVRRAIIECYSAMNRFEDVVPLARKVMQEFHHVGRKFEIARTAGYLAVAAAHLNDFEAANNALDDIESLFSELGAISWLALTFIRRGKIALIANQVDIANEAAALALSYATLCNSRYLYAQAQLLSAEVSLTTKEMAAATEIGKDVLQLARRLQLPVLRYAVHVVLGQIAEAQKDFKLSLRHFKAAQSILEYQQRFLTMTLRTTFLEDKVQALRGSIRLLLQLGDTKAAFEVLEKNKANLLLQYLFNRDTVLWNRSDPIIKGLLEELNVLRNKYLILYNQLHESLDDKPSTSLDDETPLLPVQMRSYELAMRETTEKLYLLSHERIGYNPITIPGLDSIKRGIGKDSVLLEYYFDGFEWWVFAVTESNVTARRLNMTRNDLEIAYDTFNANLAHAIRVHLDGTLDQTRKTKRLNRLCSHLNTLFEDLFIAVIRPLADVVNNAQQIIVVPFGELHYFPFNLMFDGESYLIENHSIVVLPAASLLTRPLVPRRPGATIIAHPHAKIESQINEESRRIHELFGGELYTEDAASRTVFRKTEEPYQIMHIAAHGAYRFDRPELSYIDLVDGQLYTDDLLQEDLSYELITLSACETGRGKAMLSDEIVGLGRGLLYAGAQSLLMSLWRVEDTWTVRLMDTFYTALASGKSKANALQEAQLSVVNEHSGLHPLFWGAFQLVGNANPLSEFNKHLQGDQNA